MTRQRQRKPRKLPAEPIEVVVHDLAHDGRGVGRAMGAEEAGKTIFIHGALPGERIKARLMGRTRKFDEAVSVVVEEPSAERVTPHCPWFDQCGGCALQHLDPGAQVRWKHKRLVDNLERLGQVSPQDWAEPIIGPSWGYRRRARLSVRYVPGKERVLVGFREKQGRFVADVGHCQVLHPHFADRLMSLSDLIGRLSAKAAIPQIEIAAGDQGGAMIIRHLEPLTSEDVLALKDWSAEHQTAVYLQPKGPDTVHRLMPDEHQLSYHLPSWDLTLNFGPQQFVQVNASVNEQLILRALAWLSLKPEDRVLDLFCGLGNFTLPLAKQAGTVVGVEGSADLVESAVANAQANHLANAEFHVADLSLSPESHPWMGQAFDAVLIDPPRSGAEAVLPLIGRSGAQRVVYVSCNPATLARDAGLLVREQGYRLVSAGIADMFPHTAHVESIALFEKER